MVKDRQAVISAWCHKKNYFCFVMLIICTSINQNMVLGGAIICLKSYRPTVHRCASEMTQKLAAIIGLRSSHCAAE